MDRAKSLVGALLKRRGDASGGCISIGSKQALVEAPYQASFSTEITNSGAKVSAVQVAAWGQAA